MKKIIFFIIFCFFIGNQPVKIHNDAFEIFSELFESKSDYLPANLTILDAFFNKDKAKLTINLANVHYGGTYFEYQFINMLKETAREIPGVGFLTILINNQLTELPEGSFIFQKPLFN